ALTEIRLFGGDGLFYECVLRYLAEGAEEEILEKLERFQGDLLDWRETAKELSLCELLRYLYQQTGYYDYAGMTPGGSLRQANLRLLLEKAETYENNSGKGLFHFIRFVEDMKTAETESSAAKLQSEADDLVRVMTIHKSKGLEFPVVFVADLGKQFNESDTRAAVITHQEWGYGMDYMDLDHRASYHTLSKTALAEAIKQENLSEEMRVLYVALTRAKEKLILTGTVRNLQKSMEKWAETADSTGELLPVFRLRRARNYLDWIMPALLRHPQARVLPESWEPTDRGEARQFLDEPSQWKFTFLEKGDIYGTEQEKQELAEEQQNVFENWDTEPDYSSRKEEVFRILSWKYDYETATMLPTKVSISEIKRRYQAEISGEEAPMPQELQIPQFGQKKEGLTASEIGTAMHTVMEAADLRKIYDADTLEELLAELQQQGRLMEEERAAIRRKELLAFFASDLAKRMQKADEIHKEQPFAMLVEPKEVFLDDIYQNMEEFIQINGIIDCYFVEENAVVLVDYKSDRLWQEDAFREKYKIQLRLYKEALERVTDLPVKACYIYAFAPGKTIPIDFD
ncbi:3'-5' exonuclease, partial [Anaerotignum sp.]|uniref:3'-5' exonuclease n=1 Tax=Anaerotignum sp. TaxID=2039241 RepID=UPI0039A02B0B